MNELLLLPGRALEGPRRVQLIVRPVRVAYLVDPHDATSALTAIEAACLEWGGEHHFLIPCPPNGEPDPIWSRILSKHDPDVVVDLVGASAAFVTQQRKDWDRTVERWEDPSASMLIVGAPVFGTLRSWKQKRPLGHSYHCVHLHPLAGHPLALPLAFRFGHLNARPMLPDWIVKTSYESARHREFVELTDIDPRFLGDDDLVRLLVEIPLDPAQWIPTTKSGITHYLALPQLTRLGLEYAQPNLPFDPLTGQRRPEAIDDNASSLRRIVVVGDPTSVPDLCLVWNLRAQRSSGTSLPLWIRHDWIGHTTFVAAVRWTAVHGPFDLGDFLDRGRLVHLVSATLSRDDLAKIAGESREYSPFEVDSIDRLFTSRFEFGVADDAVATFARGLTYLRIPDYATVGEFHSVDSLGWTAQIDGYLPPRRPRRLLPRLRPDRRLGTSGFSGVARAEELRPGGTLGLLTPDGAQLLAAAVAPAGYAARVSDKGVSALGVLQLFGGQEGLPVLASSRVYALLRELAQVGVRQAAQQALRRRLGDAATPEQIEALAEVIEQDVLPGAQFDRQHPDWTEFRRILGYDVPDATARLLADWLLSRRIIFRGFETKCPRCGLRRWYAVDRLATTHTCDGCQEQMPLPADVAVLPWRYRLNQLVAAAVDQGVLPHLLAANRMFQRWGRGMFADLVGLLPGSTLEPTGAVIPPRREVDVLAVRAGCLLVAECKASGNLGDRDIERTADVADRLNCSHVIYATPDQFSEEIVDRTRAASASRIVEVWHGWHLLDPRPGDGLLVDSALKYLDQLAESHLVTNW